jgi:hypothetical protein
MKMMGQIGLSKIKIDKEAYIDKNKEELTPIQQHQLQ